MAKLTFLGWVCSLICSIICGPFQPIFAEIPAELYIQGAPPIQLPASAKRWLELETRANPASIVSSRPFWIPHIEIPLAALDFDISSHIDPRLQASLLFFKEGRPYLRWILNPEDDLYSSELIFALQQKGIRVRRKKYFIGYSTASRSCLVQDPQSGFVFSAKSSTNVLGERNVNKKLTVSDAKTDRLVTDLILNNDRLPELRTALNFLPDTAAFYHIGANQAFEVREYSDLNNPGNQTSLVPLFSLGSEKIYKKLFDSIPGRSQIERHRILAQKTAAQIAKATAEYNLLYGLDLLNPHGQNILLEVDAEFNLTGRVFFRDLGDFRYAELLLNTMNGGRDLIAYYDVRGNPKFHANVFFRDVKLWPLLHNRSPNPAVEAIERYFRAAFPQAYSERAGAIIQQPLNLRTRHRDFISNFQSSRSTMSGWNWTFTTDDELIVRWAHYLGSSLNCAEEYGATRPTQ